MKAAFRLPLPLRFLLLTFSLVASSAYASIVTVNKEGDYKKRAEEIREIILDSANICDHGCKYKAPNVYQIKDLEKEKDENHFYTWSDIRNPYKSTKQFNEVEITRPGPGLIVIHVTLPSYQKIRDLREKFDLGHFPGIVSLDVYWKINERYDEQGNWVMTSVSYSNTVGLGRLAGLVSGFVRTEMNQSIEAMFENFE